MHRSMILSVALEHAARGDWSEAWRIARLDHALVSVTFEKWQPVAVRMMARRGIPVSQEQPVRGPDVSYTLDVYV